MTKYFIKSPFYNDPLPTFCIDPFKETGFYTKFKSYENDKQLFLNLNETENE